MHLIPWLTASRTVIVVLLAALGTGLALILAGLVVWRAVDEVRFRWRQRLLARYRPVVDALSTSDASEQLLADLVSTPARHRPLLGELILSLVRLQTGETVPRLREAARALGLVDRWMRDTDDPRWWVRAEAIRAVGLVREPAAFDALLRALDGEHEEVRAAAVDALGRIGDPRCGPALVARLGDESRHQRARLVGALRGLGPSVVPALLAHIRDHPALTAVTVDILGVIGGTASIDTLLDLTSADDPAVRTAALRAIGTIGLDDRSFYYVLRGLDDEDPEARAMAARALGRSGRAAAVPSLAAHLGDEWIVAAHCATGLRRLGRDGAAALETKASSTDPGAELARQMVWELTFLRAG